MKTEKNYKNVNVADDFASLLFTDDILKEIIGPVDFEKFLNIRSVGGHLDGALLKTVSRALSSWALSLGCTHYMHWFQPLTMGLAGKQNSLIKLDRNNKAFLELSANDLELSESDASSLPSGGVRSIFEARGILNWDIQSFAFIREIKDEKILYIPTKFSAFSGESLDLKTPLIASKLVLNTNMLPLVNLINSVLAKEEKQSFFRTEKSLDDMVGPEQEFFLIDRNLLKLRPDLELLGRCVFSESNVVGKFTTEHYYGGLSERVQLFFGSLNKKLNRIGIIPATQHREAAPCQFEIALRYDDSNIISDKNLILQELIREEAEHFGLVAIFSEKPFDSVNGSGKHTNYSISLESGQNLFSMGENGEFTFRFLFFVSILIRAIDEYSDLIRLATASYSNDLRLSKSEAPPCIISMYLGSEIESALSGGVESILNSVIKRRSGINSDRNRTSPIAFTGDKFEFRMPGASQSISTITTFINAALAYVSKQVFAELNRPNLSKQELAEFIAETYKKHSRIVYNDNCYSQLWQYEARRRKLKKFDTLLDVITSLDDTKNIEMLKSVSIMTKSEMQARKNIALSLYLRDLKSELAVIETICKKYVLHSLCKCIEANKALSSPHVDYNSLYTALSSELSEIEKLIKESDKVDEFDEKDIAKFSSKAKKRIASISQLLTNIERLVPEELWPFSNFDKLLYKL